MGRVADDLDDDVWGNTSFEEPRDRRVPTCVQVGHHQPRVDLRIAGREGGTYDASPDVAVDLRVDRPTPRSGPHETARLVGESAFHRRRMSTIHLTMGQEWMPSEPAGRGCYWHP